MTIRLTRIYTRTGDDGRTMIGDGSRVDKTGSRVAALADVDEVNASLGVILAVGAPPAGIADVLQRVQNELFDVGADLARPVTAETALRIEAGYVERLERDCDAANADLAPLDSFILPGGTPAAALLHVARTVTRRAERSVWALLADPDEPPGATNPLVATYLNRLSDLLFVLARAANPDGDVRWVPGASR